MKKVLIGCGIVMVILVVAVVAVGYMGFRAVKGVVETSSKLGQEYTATNTEFPFKAPEEDAVGLDQLDRWLGVRKALTPALKSFSDEMKNAKGGFTVFSTLNAQAPAIVDAHVKALREQKMSSQEYFWIARRVFTALESGDALADADLKQIVNAVSVAEKGPRGQNNNQGNQLHVPMTGAAISATLASIRERKQEMIDTAPATMAEAMIGPMIEGFTARANRTAAAGETSATQTTTATEAVAQ